VTAFKPVPKKCSNTDILENKNLKKKQKLAVRKVKKNEDKSHNNLSCLQTAAKLLSLNRSNLPTLASNQFCVQNFRSDNNPLNILYKTPQVSV